MSAFSTRVVNPDLWDDLEAYFNFKKKCSGCWCMNHRMPVGLDFSGEGARLALQELVKTNRVFGILAYEASQSIPVGWLALDPKNTLPGHDCVAYDIACSSRIWSIHCVTSRSDYKNSGVENLLCQAAITYAKEKGASEIEAYPEPGSKCSSGFQTWNTFSGFEDYFLENGFVKKDANFDGYEVLILQLK